MTMYRNANQPAFASACDAEASFSCAHTAVVVLDAILASFFVILVCLGILVSVCLVSMILVCLISLLILETTESPRERALTA